MRTMVGSSSFVRNPRKTNVTFFNGKINYLYRLHRHDTFRKNEVVEMATINTQIETLIRTKVSWEALPASVQQQLGNSAKEYEKSVLQFSIKNQLRYRGNLIKQIKKDEKRYYEELVDYSRRNLMLFPYHLSDVVVKGLRITPFQYYIMVLENIMSQEKSYDSLPNFTAVDCLRLLGIGRNQYIELMNKTRTKSKFGGLASSLFRKSYKDLLPTRPVSSLAILPWWVIQVII